MSTKPSLIPAILFILGVILLIVLAVTSGCTSNDMARNWGGTETIQLGKGETLINVTWKETDLWVLVQLPDGSKEFREYSTFGMMNGKVKFK